MHDFMLLYEKYIFYIILKGIIEDINIKMKKANND